MVSAGIPCLCSAPASGCQCQKSASLQCATIGRETEHASFRCRPASDSDSDAEVNQARLRMYERSKLRYYFAVVECDSVSTAGHLYAQCDGLEFELSANRWAPPAYP